MIVKKTLLILDACLPEMNDLEKIQGIDWVFHIRQFDFTWMFKSDYELIRAVIPKAAEYPADQVFFVTFDKRFFRDSCCRKILNPGMHILTLTKTGPYRPAGLGNLSGVPKRRLYQVFTKTIAPLLV